LLLENRLDEALRETFPASDPIAIMIDQAPARKIIHAPKVVGARSVMRASVVRGPLMAEAEQTKVGTEEPSPAALFNPHVMGIQLFNWWSLLIWGRPNNSPHTAAK
jgi:hypothetical protein